MKRNSTRVYWATAALTITLGLAYLFYSRPNLANGLDYEVFAEDLEKVAALAFDDNGALYATMELRNGEGRVVHIQQGHISTVLSDLDKPDGILLRGNDIYVTNEAGSHGLLLYSSGRVRYVGGVRNGEGIAAAGEDKILVVEDRYFDGRLLRIDTDTKMIEVLLEGLKQPEGVCQDPVGRIYYVEKALDRLSFYSDGRGMKAATGLADPGYLNCLADGSILITEDRRYSGRLLHISNSEITVLARNLHAPQAVVVGGDGAYYLSEQGKDRILRIYAP